VDRPAAKNGILIVVWQPAMPRGPPLFRAPRRRAESRGCADPDGQPFSSLSASCPLVARPAGGCPPARRPLGTVVSGGLMVATVLSLFVVPVFYVVVKQLAVVRQDQAPSPGRWALALPLMAPPPYPQRPPHRC